MTVTSISQVANPPQTRAELNARIADTRPTPTYWNRKPTYAELEQRCIDLTHHAKLNADSAAFAETARQRADRDADLAGQRADAAEQLAYRLLTENKKLRAEVSISRRAVALCSVTRAFVVTPPCRALVPSGFWDFPTCPLCHGAGGWSRRISPIEGIERIVCRCQSPALLPVLPF